MLKISHTSVNFGEVAVNDVPSYKQFQIQNTMSVPVTVMLSSTTPMINFQFTNENFSLKTGENNESGLYNENFDLVDLLESIELDAFEEKDVIVSFRAAPVAFSHISTKGPPSVFSGTLQLAANATHDGLAETLTVPFQVKVFLSCLQVSKTELQATMGPNKTQFMDFTVTNISCRPLSFVVRNQTIQTKDLDIALYEAERFEEPKLGHRLLLDSNASINLSLMVRTSTNTMPRQYQTTLQCDNMRDSRNTVVMYVNVNITNEAQGDLITTTETLLNFGDIYRGSKAFVDLGFLHGGCREDVTVTLGPSHRWRCNGELAIMKDESIVDEVTVTSQTKGVCNVKIMYKPSIDSEQVDSSKIKFEIDLIAATPSGRKQWIVVRCSAVLFTSTIVISQSNINFGDCQVGQSKRHAFSIENQSPIPGKVIIQIRSKIISIDGVPSRQNPNGNRESREEFVIGPLATLTVTLKIAPQRVNPTYHKQLTILNASNPTEDRQIINIEANNMAPSEAKLHNELYSWECRLSSSSEKNSRDGNVTSLSAITNVPVLVPYVATSKSSEPLLLNIKSTCNEIEVFYMTDASKTERLESIALELQAFCANMKVDDAKEVNPERVASVISELLSLLSDTVITTTVNLNPLESVTVFALIIRSLFSSEAVTKEDGILISVNGIETPRFVRLSYRLCGSSFELMGQKHKNFGDVNIGTKKTTKLAIVNRCKSALFLKVTKSRSVTAGHIRIEHSEQQSIFLSVRPFATKEVELTFYPGIKGAFDEKINLTNILDPQNYVVLSLKATVTKADTFDVSPDSWNFNNIVLPSIGELLPTRVGAKFTVSNTSKAHRQIRLALDASNFSAFVDSGEGKASELDVLKLEGVHIKVQVDMELSGSSSGSTRKIEEQIEKLEQKLKIYERKKKKDKLEAGKKRIESLRRALLGEEVDLNATDGAAGSPDIDFSESEDEMQPKKPQPVEALSQLLREGLPLPVMNAGESVTITFGLTCQRVDDAVPAVQSNTLNLLLYEAKDKEVNRIIPIDITLIRPEAELSTAPSTTEDGQSSAASMPLVVPDAIASPSKISLELNNFGRAVSKFMGFPLVGLRNCVVNEQAELSLVVRTTKNTTIVVLEPRRCGGAVNQALDARFNFFPRNGAVKADEPLRIVVECKPQSVGPQKYLIALKNLQNTADIHYFVVDLNPTEEEERVSVEPKELTFHDIVTPCDEKKLETKLLLLRSRFPYPHVLLVRASKPSQIKFYEDASCTIPLENPIQRTFLKETVRVYVRYHPSPMSKQATSRIVHGGVLVEAIASNGPGQYCTVGKSVVRVRTRVGSGLVVVPQTALELGSISPKETSTMTMLTLYNPSDTFQIALKVAPASANVSVESENVILLAGEERRLMVALRLPSPGLFREHITVSNLSCQQESIAVTVSALRRDEAISSVEKAVVMPIAAIAKGEGGVFQLHNSVSSRVAIRNHSTKDIIAVASQPDNAPLVLGQDSAVLPGGEAAAAGGSHLVSSVSSRARLEARHTQRITWALTGVPQLSAEQVRAILSHQLVSIKAMVQVQVAQIVDEVGMSYTLFRGNRQLPVAGQCVLLLPFTVPLAMSEGRVEPMEVDLGAVGHVDKAENRFHHRDHHHVGDHSSSTDASTSSPHHPRQNSAIKVRLSNLSPHLPLHLNVACPPVIRFTNSRFAIPPGESMEVEATIQLKQITAQGPFRYQAFFVNELNPENDIAVSITGQYYWKVFQLYCKGRAINESLKIASLRVDVASSTPSIISEEKLTVTATEEDIKLYVTIQPNPKLEGIVDLQVLHYDATPIAKYVSFQSHLPHVATNAASPSSGGDGATPVSNGIPGGAATTPGGGGGGGSSAPGGSKSTATGSGGNGGTTPSATPGSTAPLAGTAATSGQQHRRKHLSQTLRLRCHLLSSDMAAMAALFFSGRKKQVSQEVITFDRVGELEKRRTSPDSVNMWIGTVTFSNHLTNDEDVEIYAQLDSISTFSASSKLSLQPCRMPSQKNTDISTKTLPLQLAYVGRMTVSSSCLAYAAELSLVVVISPNLSVPVVVEVMGGSPAHVPPRSGDDEGENSSPPPSTTTFVMTTFTNSPTMPSATDGVLPPSGAGHRFSIKPEDSVSLEVIVRALDPEDAADLQQSTVEQCIAVVILDENVPSSVNVTRVSVAPFEGDEGDAPLYQQQQQQADVAEKAVSSRCTTAALEADAASTATAAPPDATATASEAAARGSTGADNRGATAVPSTSAQPPPAQVLSLRNCTPVPGCVGAYSSSFSMARDEGPTTTIAIRNNLSDRPVEYTVQVTSQGPLPWLLLPSTSGSLEGGETHQLRLTILSAEVGTFVGYVEIHNSVNPREVVYLRLSAEIFLPSTGEGLIEVTASNGQRVSTNAAHHMNLGHIYGAGAFRAFVAVEIVNKGSVALEFPVSVIKPFRTELRPVQDTMLPISVYHGGHHEPQQGGGYPQEVSPVGGASLPPGSQPAYFEGRLVACHISGVPTQNEQKYVVVDPKSRVRLAFVLSCSELRVPDGFGIYGEADIVFKCKQARDANFTFRAQFHASQPTFTTAREYNIPTTSELGRTTVPVHNNLTVPQVFQFRSHSPVVYVTCGTGDLEKDEAAVAELLETAGRQNSSKYVSTSAYLTDSVSFSELHVAAQSTGYFIVLLDHKRAAALLNFDEEDGERPALCEHGFVLNGSNPRERVRLDFNQFPSNHPRATPTTNAPTSDSNHGGRLPAYAGRAPRVVIKPVKVGGQHISEKFVMIFAQHFTTTLSEAADKLLATFRHYQARRESGGEAEAGDGSGGGGAGGAGGGRAHHGTPTGHRASDSDLSDSDSALGDNANNNIRHHSSLVDVLSVPEASPVAASLSPSAEVDSARAEAGGAAAQFRGPSATTSGSRHALSAETWDTLRGILLELTWLVDELNFYIILLRNSRLIEGYCAFLTAAVTGHPVMKAWRQCRHYLPHVREYHIFSQIVETLEGLPFATATTATY